jgi:hypothetical protein
MRLLRSSSLILLSTIVIAKPQAHVSGILTDSSSKEKLVGADIIPHSNKKDYKAITKSAGEFKFANVEAGDYKLVIDFVGYEKFSKQINIAAATINLNIELQQNTNTLAAVNVFATINGEIEAGSRLREKNANNIVNVISAEAMQRSPDINAANVLQRMSGVTLQKNSGADEAYAIIRGLEPRYNNTLING